MPENPEPNQPPDRKPTLKVDGFEERIGPSNIRPSLEPGLASVHIGTVDTGDGLSRFSRDIIYDPFRADALRITATDAGSRGVISQLLTEGGFVQFTPAFDIHVVAARTKPQPSEETQS